MFSNLFLPIPGSVVGNFLGTSATFVDIGATFPSPVNRDFIIVQVDETHTDQQTVYMYSGATSAWVYIGVWSSAEKAEHRYIDFDLEPNVASTAGRLFWDAAAQTLALGMPGGSVNLQIGEEQLVRVKNTTGGDLLNGTPVYLTANPAEGFISIGLSDSESQDNCRKTIAVLTEDIDHNQFGYATTFGLVRELNTNAWTEGDELFVKATGGLTNVMPAAPEAVVRVGIVVQKSATEGVIFVDIIPLSMKELLVDSGDLTIKMEAGKTVVLSPEPFNEMVPNITVLAQGAASPDLVNHTIHGVVGAYYSFDGTATEERLSVKIELLHGYKEGSDIEIHVHAMPDGNTAGNVEWFFDYFKSPINAPSALGGTLSAIAAVAVNSQYADVTKSLGIIPGAGLKIGDFIIGTLRRTPLGVNDTYAGEMLFKQVAAHVLLDTLGSRARYTK